jgi:translation initiation factor IF-3
MKMMTNNYSKRHQQQPTTQDGNIDDNDKDTKMKQIKGFISDGDNVKVTLRLRGREMAHPELGVKVLERVKTELAELAKVESMPRLENRQMIMVLAPK